MPKRVVGSRPSVHAPTPSTAEVELLLLGLLEQVRGAVSIDRFTELHEQVLSVRPQVDALLSASPSTEVWMLFSYAEAVSRARIGERALQLTREQHQIEDSLLVILDQVRRGRGVLIAQGQQLRDARRQVDKLGATQGQREVLEVLLGYVCRVHALAEVRENEQYRAGFAASQQRSASRSSGLSQQYFHPPPRLSRDRGRGAGFGL